MEIIDVFVFSATTFFLGILIGSDLKKSERKLEFMRGEHATISRYWPLIVWAYMEHPKSNYQRKPNAPHQQPASRQASDGQASP